MRLFRKSMAVIVTVVLALSFCTIGASAAGQPIQTSAKQILSFDNLENSVDGGGEINTTEFIEGLGAYFSKPLAEGGVFAPTKVFATPIDMSLLEQDNTCLEVYLYVNDPELLGHPVNFEITSSGKCDVEEYEWHVDPSYLTAGWNLVRLPVFRDAHARGNTEGEPNLKAVNFFRTYTINAVAGLIYGVDNLKLVKYDGDWDEDAIAISKPKVTPIYDYEEMAGTKLDKVDYFAGSGSFASGVLGAGANGWFVQPKNFETPLDLSMLEKENAVVEFRVFVSDPSKMSLPLFFELTSGGISDIDEFQWTIPADQLYAGWNLVSFKLADAVATPDNPKINAINFMRAFQIDPTTEGLELKYDDVRVVEYNWPVPTVMNLTAPKREAPVDTPPEGNGGTTDGGTTNGGGNGNAETGDMGVIGFAALALAAAACTFVLKKAK